MKPEAQCHPEGVAVYAAGGWSEDRAFYPGRSAALPRPETDGVLPAPQGAGMERQRSAEVIVVGDTGRRRAEQAVPKKGRAFNGDRRRRRRV